MAKVYERINWEDLPSKNTPINAENLNKMDKAIDKLDDKIVELEENGGSGGDYLEKTNPTGTGSFSMNRKADTAVGDCSHAEGYDTTASGGYSHAEGAGAIASGLNSHGEGNCTIASGENAHAEGYRTTASGYHSHAEGFGAQSTLTDGSWTHEYKTNAKGLGSHAEGVFTIAGGRASHSEGEGTIASGTYQHVQGKYNVEDTKNEFAHIIGGGASDTGRKNIHTLDWLGNAIFAGDVINGNGVTMDELKTLIEKLSGQVQALTARLDVLQTTS